MKMIVLELYISFLHRLSEEAFKINEFREQNHVDCVFHKLIEEWKQGSYLLHIEQLSIFRCYNQVKYAKIFQSRSDIVVFVNQIESYVNSRVGWGRIIAENCRIIVGLLEEEIQPDLSTCLYRILSESQRNRSGVQQSLDNWVVQLFERF